MLGCFYSAVCDATQMDNWGFSFSINLYLCFHLSYKNLTLHQNMSQVTAATSLKMKDLGLIDLMSDRIFT